MRRYGIGFKRGADFIPVHIGHHDVEQDDVGLLRPGDLQRRLAVISRKHLVIFKRQPGFKQLHIDRNIIDDKDTSGHKPKLPGVNRERCLSFQ